MMSGGGWMTGNGMDGELLAGLGGVRWRECCCGVKIVLLVDYRVTVIPSFFSLFPTA